jgi:hypothetical protein
LFFGGNLRGAKPPSQKMGFFKAEGLISGWVGKIRNNLYFRITRQGTFKNKFSFKIYSLQIWQKPKKIIMKF